MMLCEHIKHFTDTFLLHLKVSFSATVAMLQLCEQQHPANSQYSIINNNTQDAMHITVVNFIGRLAQSNSRLWQQSATVYPVGFHAHTCWKHLEVTGSAALLALLNSTDTPLTFTSGGGGDGDGVRDGCRARGLVSVKLREVRTILWHVCDNKTVQPLTPTIIFSWP